MDSDFKRRIFFNAIDICKMRLFFTKYFGLFQENVRGNFEGRRNEQF